MKIITRDSDEKFLETPIKVRKAQAMMIALNGKIIPAESACIAYNDRGLLLADGLFETMLSHHGQVFFLKGHWERLEKGANLSKIPLTLSLSQLENTISEILGLNDLAIGYASLRLTLTRGVGGRGITPPPDPQPTVMLACSPFQPPTQPANLYISSIRRNEFSPLANIKSLCNLDNILARQEAIEQGADEGLLLNTKGHVAEASAANIFLVDGSGAVLTPALAEGALPGIVRGQIINVCKENKIAVTEAVVTTEMLFSAAEVFLTNSLIGVQPVRMINSHIITNDIGTTTNFLQACYNSRK